MQLGLFVQVVENHLGHRAALEFDHQAHARFVRLVLNMADVFDFLFVHQLGHAFLQGLFVHLIGQLIDDDGLSLAAVYVFEMAFGPHDHAAATGAVTFLHATDAVNNAGGGEVGCRHDVYQFVYRCLGVAQQVQTSVHHLIEVVRRNVGGHAHRNTGRAIHQQIGKLGWHDQRFSFATVVVGTKVNRFFVQVGKQFMRNFGQPNFRVTHGRGVVAIHRTEVTLSIHQHMS